jgi:hypothetical protein
MSPEIEMRHPDWGGAGGSSLDDQTASSSTKGLRKVLDGIHGN